MQDTHYARARALLREIYGHDSSFRDGQWDAIREVAVRRGQLLVVQRTGWGKSLVYLIATRLLREEGEGPTLLISPLRAFYGDAGWGSEVASGKYKVKRFSEALVAASIELIQTRWKPDPPPAWVTAVPSLRDPALVYDFSARLADQLALTFVPVLQKTVERPPQKTMENSTQQLRNVIDAFRISATLPSGPVLLIDDVVDSKWKVTVVAWLLLSNGGGPVYPFALASAAIGGT